MSRQAEALKLYILRHGEAGTHEEDPEKDAVRPLTGSGRKEIERLAESFKTSRTKFDLIATSPLRRAEETGMIVAKKLKLSNRFEEWDELKPTSDTDALYSRLSKLKKGSRVMIVGHEPHLSGMISEVISGKTAVGLVLKKGALAKVNVNEFQPKISGELVWLVTPKLLKKMAG